MPYVGGLRARLIKDSVHSTLRTSLSALGWFTPGASHSPVTLLAEPVAVDTEVPFNTLAISDEVSTTDEIEMGSRLSDVPWTFFVDFYAENDSIGLHMIRDIKDILEGRFPSIGRNAPIIPVYDYTLATPVQIFVVEVEDVRVDKAHDFPQPWLRHWRECNFTIIDTYEDEMS